MVGSMAANTVTSARAVRLARKSRPTEIKVFLYNEVFKVGLLGCGRPSIQKV
jgi:hypothetical protein